MRRFRDVVVGQQYRANFSHGVRQVRGRWVPDYRWETVTVVRKRSGSGGCIVQRSDGTFWAFGWYLLEPVAAQKGDEASQST